MQAEDMQDIIASVLQAYPVILRALPYDVGITVADREKYLAYEPAKNLDLKVPVGQPIREGSLVHRTMNENRYIS